MQTGTKQIIRVLFLTWLFVTLFVSSNSASAYTASILSAGSVTINLDGTAETGTTTSDLTINTTCPAGYIVQVSGTNASNNHNLYLNGNSSNDTTVIFNSAGTVSSPITLADNTWGIQVGVNTYTGISNTPQDFSIGTSGSYVAGEDITLPVTYGARNGGSLMSGTYTMDNGNVLYTLVMDGTCIPYTITYDGNTATTGIMDTTTYKHEFTPGTTTSFDLYASNFSKTGYGFVGWGTRPLVASTAAELNTAVTNETITIYGPNETITAPSYFDLLPRSSGNKKLYAVWLASQGNLQGWAGCSSMSIGDVTALTDTRDNNTYAIAKLADGNCWMIENSRLDPAGMTLNKTNTNYANQEFIEYASSLSNSTFNTCSTADDNYECIEQYSVGMGNVTGLTANALNGDQSTRWYSYGAMYNWFTATAYTVSDAFSQMPSENYISVPGDICPVGWHLPYGGSDSGTKGGNTSGGFYYLGTELEATASNAASSNIWRSFPNNFIYSGSYDEALVQDRGLSGYYWSPTTTMDGSIFFFNLEGSDVSVAGALDALDSNAGFAIRCVASMPETFTLSYDANGGTGTPASQTTTGNGIASFTISNITPTHSGYTFAGWSDVDGQAIQAGETYSTTETTATLFAKWNNNSCNPSATTIGTGNTSTDAVCLQDINSTIRGTMSIATTSTGTYTLIDARDNKTYTIAKLDDGNIWLTQNLDFAPSVDTFIAANDSDVPGFLVPAASNEFITDDQSYDDSFPITPKVMSDSTYGGYYSFAAAIASTTAYRDRQIITTSICPKGWDLPTVDHFDILGDYVQDPNVMINVPYSFTLPGYRWGTEFYNQGDGFYYWSSTNQDGWNDGFGNYKLQGEAVRCIASNGTGTIHYYANGGTGTMPDQTVEINAGQAKFNEFTAPEHTQFMEWNTEADGSGTPVEEGQSIIGSGLVEGGSISLYAQWQHSYLINYNINGGDEGVMNNITEFSEGESVALIASNFSRPNYGFAGWSTNPNAQPGDGISTIYGPNETITTDSSFLANADSNYNITMYAIWVQSEDSLQGWTGCSSMNAGDVTALTDTRDNNTYAVAKLADGNCWMIENLRLDLSANGDDIAVYNTNHPTTTFVSEAHAMQGSTSTWDTCLNTDSNCFEHISSTTSDVNRNYTASHDATNQTSQWYSYGAHYNWYTATAGNGVYGTTANTSLSGDICPAGWFLPYGNTTTNTGNRSGGFYYLGVQLQATANNQNSAKKWLQYPNNFVYSGYYSGQSSHNRGYGGIYWSSTSSGNYLSYTAQIYNGYLNISNSSYKNNGLTIRCIVKNTLDTITLTYNANGGTGAPDTAQTATGNGVAGFTVSSVIPTRSGFTFDGWSDKNGQVVNGGDTYYAGDINAVLYALWTNNTCNPTATTIGTGNTSTDAVCLQDMNSTIKGTMSIATASTGTYTLKDARDNQEYIIAKLVDGNVWMTKNLNFAPSEDMLISSA
ncbi:InlB B-repeat-containing protein, partial [Candidatus Saccharibacteria bacterium]|nr:InlB B-repeat-containing protein [Candidatus Saccharibacteria bacterium]